MKYVFIVSIKREKLFPFSFSHFYLTREIAGKSDFIEWKKREKNFFPFGRHLRLYFYFFFFLQVQKRLGFPIRKKTIERTNNKSIMSNELGEIYR